MDSFRKLIEERQKQPPEVFYKKGVLKNFEGMLLEGQHSVAR